MKLLLSYVLALSLVSISVLWAASPLKEAKGAADVTGEDDVVVDSQDSAPVATHQFKAQRAALMDQLKKEIEPNLVKADIEKLTRSVLRLGSYRADWAAKGFDFVLANAPLAEPYLYKFSLSGNTQLDQHILKALVSLPSLRFPKAALYFSEVMATTPKDKIKLLTLFEKALKQDSSLGNETIAWLEGSWGQEIPLVEKLLFASRSCQPLEQVNEASRAILEGWVKSAASFWEKLPASDLRVCLRLLPEPPAEALPAASEPSVFE